VQLGAEVSPGAFRRGPAGRSVRVNAARPYPCPMIEISLEELESTFGFGVAGNFAGHLEQAGEASDFVTVEADADAPKGIFPWYIPGLAGDDTPSFLHTFPLSDANITVPAGSDNLQIEPEVGLLADVEYAADGSAVGVTPVAIAAFNDCSIRRPGAKKISQKKNWGPASKGVAGRFFPVDRLDADGPTAGFRLASFLIRDGVAHPYGQDSALADYSYYGRRLLDWIVERLNHQQGSDDTPLEPVGAYLRAAGNPVRLLIGIGATRYTEYGESTYLENDDHSVVVVYDSAAHTPEEIRAAVSAGDDAGLTQASVLRQQVIGS
jgi:hypothetical protein